MSTETFVSQKPSETTLYNMNTERKPTGSSRGLIGEMLRKESEDKIRDEFLEINNNASIIGDVPLTKETPFIWVFLDPGANYLEPGTHYYGDFIGRVLDWADGDIKLGLLAWRPTGSQRDYQRIAKLAKAPLPNIKLTNTGGGTLDCGLFKRGDLVHCSARVTLWPNTLSVGFEFGPYGLRKLYEAEVVNDKQ
jgi:hypothetical protein